MTDLKRHNISTSWTRETSIDDLRFVISDLWNVAEQERTRRSASLHELPLRMGEPRSVVAVTKT